MLTVVKNNLRFLFTALKTSILSAMEYKVSFILQSLFMFISNGFFLIFWSVTLNIANSTTNLGFTMDTILYIWSIPTIGFGVAYFFFGGAQEINRHILNGSLDSFLLQPKSVLLNVLTSKCVFSACGDFIYGVVIGFVVSNGDMLEFTVILLLGIFVSIFFIATEIITRSLCVWLGDTEQLSKRYINSLTLTFATYPEQIFSKSVKVLLYTVVPSAYICHIPIKIITNFNYMYVILIVIGALVYLSVAIYIFYKAISKYESGNLVSMKM